MRIITQQQAADENGVCVKTIRNWISRGHITGYRTPAGRAIRVDADEIRLNMSVIPAMRRGTQPFGPKAKIRTLPVSQ